MEQMPMSTETSPVEPEQEVGGIDQIISQVDSYIQDPKMVTPATLMGLKESLMDLKGFLDGEEQGEPQADSAEPTAISEMMAKQGGMR